jgi:AcrR family transcriptional regulator
VTWREQAVARSLDTARARAEKRVQRFLDAALELMITSPDKEFTVQEVVERSGQSLRSFYQHFASKHELLHALFEESVRSTADRLQELIADEDDAVARFHRLVVEYYRMCRPAPNGSAAKPLTPAMAEFAQQLLTAQPADASRAFSPLVLLFERALADAAATGAVRGDVSVIGVLLQTIMFNAFATTIGRSQAQVDDAAEQLWDLILNGISSRVPT